MDNILDDLVGHVVEVVGFQDGELQLNMSNGKIYIFIVEGEECRIEVHDTQ